MSENTSEPPPAKPSLPMGNLMPALTRKPLFLLWIWALPIGILLACNLFLYSIHGPDMEAQAQNSFQLLLGLNITNLALAIVASAFLQHRTKEVSPWLGLAILLAQIAHLWIGYESMVTFTGRDSDWFMPTSRVWGYQYTFCILPAFYGLLSFAGTKLPTTRRTDLACTVLASTLPPALLYLSIHLTRYDAPRALFVPLLVIGGTLMFLGLGRIGLHALRGIQKNKKLGTCLKILFAIVLPLSGLWLNTKIRFPADFQILDIYLFTIANGILLCIPSPQNVPARRILFALQCICYPFSIYFFLVFLPFLPLAILAVVIAGAGFLILAPVFLFILHTSMLAERFRNLFPEARLAQKTLLVGLILLLPAWYLAQAHLDRKFLHQGIHHVLSPDLDATDPFSGSRTLTLRSIQRLADYKNGKYLPHLSDIYAKYVFNNLTLPNEKMRRIYQAFHGKEWTPPKADPPIDFWSRSAGDRWQAPPTRSFDRKVEMTIGEIQHTHEHGLVRTRAVLKLKNLGQDQNEFVTTIHIPEGVFISGYWLHVEDQRVPGRLFESKTAMWVYQMIRDFERRDPGILAYETPTRLKLRVFPFASDPKSPFHLRTTEIEFLYPEGWKPRITIDDQVLDLGKAEPTPRTFLAETASGAMLVVPSEIRQILPAVLRTPYLHFNIDRSRYGKSKSQHNLETIRTHAHKFPEVTDYTLALANYDYQEQLSEPNALADLQTHLENQQQDTLPARGGFLQSLSEARALHRYKHSFLDTGETARSLRVPILRTITHHPNPITQQLPIEEMRARFTPDHPEQGITPVILLRKGQIIRPLAQEHTQGLAALFQNAKPDAPLEFYDPEQQTWTHFPTVVFPSGSPYSDAAELHLLGTTAQLNPRERSRQQRHIVLKSKKTGILSRLTNYIAVENHAQWKALELSEKNKLAQNPELEFMENPEPPLWLLAILLLTIGGLAQRRRPPA